MRRTNNINLKDKMEENLYTTDSIRTFTGKYVNVFNPDPNTIDIIDIAHALSNIPRFGGHLRYFYSVAQHSLACYIKAKEEFKLEALMHDAAEAYLLDMPKPIKERMPEYQKVEKDLQRVICNKFGLPFPKSIEVEKIDKFMLEEEWDNLMLKESFFGHNDKMQTKESFLTMFNLEMNKLKTKTK